MTALLISHSFAREGTEHLTGCGKKICENFVAMLRHTMQKIASHCKLICSQIDKTVSSTKIAGMLLCCKKKIQSGVSKVLQETTMYFICGFELA